MTNPPSIPPGGQPPAGGPTPEVPARAEIASSAPETFPAAPSPDSAATVVINLGAQETPGQVTEDMASGKVRDEAIALEQGAGDATREAIIKKFTTDEQGNPKEPSLVEIVAASSIIPKPDDPRYAEFQEKYVAEANRDIEYDKQKQAIEERYKDSPEERGNALKQLDAVRDVLAAARYLDTLTPEQLQQLQHDPLVVMQQHTTGEMLQKAENGSLLPPELNDIFTGMAEVAALQEKVANGQATPEELAQKQAELQAKAEKEGLWNIIKSNAKEHWPWWVAVFIALVQPFGPTIPLVGVSFLFGTPGILDVIGEAREAGHHAGGAGHSTSETHPPTSVDAPPPPADTPVPDKPTPASGGSTSTTPPPTEIAA